LRTALERARLSSSARRSANRALRDLDDGTSQDAYWRQSIWKRIAVTGAGPVMNLVVALVIFTIVYATGAPTNNPSTKVAAVERNTPAASAGLQPGDLVVAVDGKPTPTFDRLHALIAAGHGRPIVVTVVRRGTRIELPPRSPQLTDKRWVYGFLPAQQIKSYPIGTSIGNAFHLAGRVVTGTLGAFGGLAHSKQRAQLTTVVGIAKVSQQDLRASFHDYLGDVGIVSMSLALLNLLPFLPLDGGHILFSLLEGVRRRAIARELYERVSVIGFSLLILIFFIALNNDLGRYFHG
jgi:regulator of sigma E protease